MSSSTLTPFYTNALTNSYSLIASGETKSIWKDEGRDLATPSTISIERRIGPSNAKTNDHVIVKFSRTERNSTTGALATATVTLDIGIPRDTVTVTKTIIVQMVAQLTSLLENSTAIEASQTNITTLVEGLDL